VEEHWHNIYVAEKINEAVGLLRSQGIGVDYDFKPKDPDDANGYIEKNGGVLSSCVRWRKRDPNFEVSAEAMTCIQLLSSAINFPVLQSVIKLNFRIIQDCQAC